MKEMMETYFDTIIEIVIMSIFVGIAINTMNMVFAIQTKALYNGIAKKD